MKVESFLILMLFTGVARAAVIEEIRFNGNDVTQEVVMLREMTVKPGDVADMKKIKKSVQYIMNLGLFERVTYSTEPGKDAESIVLLVTVIERYYLLPLPTAKLNDDNHVEYGVKLRWNNVWGLNHRLNWDLINKGPELGARQFTTSFDYLIPRPFSSRYVVNMSIDFERDADDDPVNGEQLQLSSGFGFDVMRWLGKDGVSQGLFAGGGTQYRQKIITSLNPLLAVPVQNQDAVIYAARIGYSGIEEYEFNRAGIFLQYKIETSADDKPGFSVPFVKHEINYKHIHSVGDYPPSNFDYNIVIGSSDNDVLGDKAFSIGGSANLRGYETDAYRGNAMFRANVEYLSAFTDSPAFRKVFFIDIGDTQEKLGDIKFSTLKTGVGTGIRWKVKRFVGLDIRVDVAYGFDASEFRLALGTHNTF
ncbi:MAG: BamA/TamA family outer membrane protein [Gammaproteobacteria bacterium]|nr:BamA/TamA family outer membrane protein [Gammaproteobacteria bacterium]